MFKHQDESTFAFLRLPRELRDEIYQLLIEKHATVRVTAATFDHRIHISVLQISRQIRDEALDFFFAHATVHQRIPERFLGPNAVPSSMMARVRRLRLDLPATMIYGQNLFGWFSSSAHVPCDWLSTLDSIRKHLSAYPNLISATVEASFIISMRRLENEAELTVAWKTHPLNKDPVLKQFIIQISDLGQGASTAWKYSACTGYGCRYPSIMVLSRGPTDEMSSATQEDYQI
ncbi:hypothetical protein EJ05DRAFT_105425 [Pseudovirgaria hyperparasitica]|uniref:F-box domain-containing protein n=1 Tax=Pseudovirgaria hyperparasitica TaxID=470096 RepID=A0A6A6VZA0_9PEZI|nr:uncharacterized protein EJ05DRAFT_105425 [Pseudovirgaria hyperparasitica]KAF2755565.1 hypothetical protein EJ05DRAFT_105425 [Pseudovirgaria hyperparasitica]